MGHRFRVDQSVLIPRQDTETLVLEAAKTVQNNSRQKLSLIERLRGGKEWELLDLCCGSGAVGISMAKICDNIQLTGTDISGAAVAMAETNAKSLRVKAEFLVGDLFEPVKGRKFDMIVSNPPYIKTNMIAVLQEEIKNYEPREALDGGRDGLNYYRRIIKEAPEYLKKDGFLFFEIGHDQGEDLRKMLKDDGRFTPAEVIRDLPGRDRVVKCQVKG